MLKYKFNFDKTVQACGVVLRSHGKRMDYLRLLKLLYIADRELIAATGNPLTGDRVVAMKHGPVLSHVYDLIKQQGGKAGEWDAFIHTDGYQVELVKDPGGGHLTRGEVAKLTELCDRYRSVGDWELVDRTHEFPEWKENFRPGTATAIVWDDVLRAQGREGMIPQIESDLAAKRALDAIFGS
jgi:uncharacterized phage-associated protein